MLDNHRFRFGAAICYSKNERMYISTQYGSRIELEMFIGHLVRGYEKHCLL